MTLKKAKIIKNGNVNLEKIVSGKNKKLKPEDIVIPKDFKWGNLFTQPYAPIKIVRREKLKKGDFFLWRSAQTSRLEMHQFHSDAGYGAKTFTDYNEKTGSSLIVNYSGICGVLVCDEKFSDKAKAQTQAMNADVIVPYKRHELEYHQSDVKKITGIEPFYNYEKEGHCTIYKWRDSKGNDVTEQEVIARVQLYMVANGIIDEKDKLRSWLTPSHHFSSEDDEGSRHSVYNFTLRFVIR